MIGFFRNSRQKYWPGAQARGERDDIYVGEYEDGSSTWEFQIIEERFNESIAGKESAVRVLIFEDAVRCLNNRRVLIALKSLEGCETLDEVEAKLKAAGLKEIGAREAKG